MKWLINYYNTHNNVINIVSIITGILGTFFGVYTYLFPLDASPKLTFVELNETALFTSNKDIKGLKVLYQDKDLNQEGTNLIVKRIMAVNFGKSPLRLNDYSNDGLQLHFMNCRLISVQTERLKEKPIAQEFNPQVKDSVSLGFNKAVFNPDESVIFTVYLLHRNTTKEIEYLPFGRIAGQDKIRKMTEKEVLEDKSIFVKLIEVVKAMFPLIAALIGFYLFINIIYYIIKSYRKKRITKKYSYQIKDINEIQQDLIDIYTELGETDFLDRMKEILNDKDFLKRQEKILKAFKTLEPFKSKDDKYEKSTQLTFYNALKDTGYIIKDETGTYVLTKEFEAEIINIMDLLSR